jgi:signal peptidase II
MTSGRIAFMVVAAVVFVLDRITKSLVVSQIPYGTEVPVLGRLLAIANVHNSGAAFGILPAGSAFFLVAAIVVAVGLVVYVARTPGNLGTDIPLGLILGGTLGNGYDRIMFGTVTDFVNFHFWPVFNVADAAISTGVVLLIGGYLLRKQPTA